MECILVMVRCLIVFLIVLLGQSAEAQYYNIGQEPWSVKWEQIVSQDFKVIYPRQFREKAVKTSELLKESRLSVSRSLNISAPFTPVILHTGNVYSNAYAIWAPRRLEFLTVPPQNTYAQPWIDQLVLHEFRHIAQISKVNQGFTKVLGYIFGQQAAPAVLGLFIPPWFMEGDAVATETALSQSGRGRIANFAMPLRAQIKEIGKYSYSKAVLGSYRDFIPDEYVLGYHIVASSRQKYSNAVWNSALNLTGRSPYRLNPFSKGIKDITTLNKKNLYNEATKRLDSLWTNKTVTEETGIAFPVKETGVYTNYSHPFLFQKNIIALRSSLSDIPRFVRIDSLGNEKIIHTPGYLLTSDISFNGTWLSWIEQRPHVRWENVGFSTIVLLNPSTNEINRIKTTLKVYAPAVNPTNSLIAVSEVSDNGDFYITILDFNGNVIKRTKTPTDAFLSSPAWSSDGNNIVCVSTSNKGKQIVNYNNLSSLFTELSDYSFTEISSPYYSDRGVLFSMDINERSEVFLLDITNRELYRQTFSNYGTGQPFSTGNELVYQDYTPNGYRIKHSKLSENISVTDTKILLNNWPMAKALQDEELRLKASDPVSKIQSPNKDISEIKNYSRMSGLVNIHSWAPLYINIDDQEFYPGVSLMSQNLLSTLFMTAGYEYNTEEESGLMKANISWEGWFPTISSSVSYGGRSAIAGSKDSTFRLSWNETTWNIGITQILQTLAGKYSVGGFVNLNHQLIQTSRNNETPDNFTGGRIGSGDLRLGGFFYEKTALRDLAPRTGLRLDFHFKKSLYGSIKAGDLISFQARAYLPGFVRNHSLQLFGAFQKLQVSSTGYRFSGDIGIPAGFSERTPSSLVRFRPSYSLPVMYPDLSIGTVFYLKRIRANAFYDIAVGDDKSYTTIGADAIADFHLFTLPYPISAGIRVSYLSQRETIQPSLILSYDLSGY